MALNPEFEKIGYDIIASAFEVRNHAGFKLREKFYEAALKFELEARGYKVEEQSTIKAFYKGVEICDAFVADLIVDDRVVIELKSLNYMTHEEVKQLHTYLVMGGYKLGYLINFGAENFKTGKLVENEYPYYYGIYRMVNGIDD